MNLSSEIARHKNELKRLSELLEQENKVNFQKYIGKCYVHGQNGAIQIKSIEYLFEGEEDTAGVECIYADIKNGSPYFSDSHSFRITFSRAGKEITVDDFKKILSEVSIAISSYNVK